MAAFQAARWLIDSEVPPQAGNNHPTGIPMGVFPTADGAINIAAAGDVLWQRFLGVIEAPELADDERFVNGDARSKNRDVLNALLGEFTAKKPSAHWIEAMNEAGVPCGPLNSIDEPFAAPQVRREEGRLGPGHPFQGGEDVAQDSQVPGVEGEVDRPLQERRTFRPGPRLTDGALAGEHELDEAAPPPGRRAPRRAGVGAVRDHLGRDLGLPLGRREGPVEATGGADPTDVVDRERRLHRRWGGRIKAGSRSVQSAAPNRRRAVKANVRQVRQPQLSPPIGGARGIAGQHLQHDPQLAVLETREEAEAAHALGPDRQPGLGGGAGVRTDAFGQAPGRDMNLDRAPGQRVGEAELQLGDLLLDAGVPRVSGPHAQDGLLQGGDDHGSFIGGPGPGFSAFASRA